jgi:uncharacterized phage protein gp47/JayE
MAFTRPTLDTLKTRIKNDITSRLTGNAPLLRYSLLGILATVFAGAMHILYGYLDWIAKQILPDTADREWLIRHGLMWLKVPPRAPVFATGNITFTGTNGSTIPSGTRVVSDAGLEYTTNALGTIASGTSTVAMTAASSGVASNLPAGAILSLSSPIAGVTNLCTVPTEIANGAEEETSESLLSRILARIRNSPAGGTKTDYVDWALAASTNVRKAWCFPNYLGLGTVSVVIIQQGATPAAPGGLISTVQTYIDTDKSPVGAAVTVATINPRVIAFVISVKPNDGTVTTRITAALTTLFSNEASPAGNAPAGSSVPPGTVLISHIRDAISDVLGLVDFEITTMTRDGSGIPIDDVVLTGFDFAVLGGITYNTLS